MRRYGLVIPQLRHLDSEGEEKSLGCSAWDIHVEASESEKWRGGASAQSHGFKAMNSARRVRPDGVYASGFV